MDDDEMRRRFMEAESEWRSFRPFFWPSVAVASAILVAAAVWWPLSDLQFACLSVAVGAFIRAVYVFFGKGEGGASAFWLVAGVVCLVGTLPTGLGRWMASAVDTGQTVHDAGTNIFGIILLPIIVPIAVVIFGAAALFGLGALGTGIVGLVKLPFAKGPRPAFDEHPAAAILAGIFILSALALMAYLMWRGWPLMVDEILGPFRKIKSWF